MTSTTKKLIGAAALAGGVAFGSIGGALIGAPSTSGAVEDPTAAESPAGPWHDGGFRRGPGVGSHHGFDLATVAEAIGISEDDLRIALEDGQSIAEVAEANGVDPQAVVDTLVAAANARLDEAVAAGDLDAERAEEIRAGLAERIAAHVHRDGSFRGGPGRPGLRHLDLVAETIGIEPEALREALAGGQTIAEAAEANGVDPQAVIDALVAEATERITAHVNGTD